MTTAASFAKASFPILHLGYDLLVGASLLMVNREVACLFWVH